VTSLVMINLTGNFGPDDQFQASSLLVHDKELIYFYKTGHQPTGQAGHDQTGHKSIKGSNPGLYPGTDLKYFMHDPGLYCKGFGHYETVL
jgi:hypothetical protein